jgi:UDP-N-acetylmuramoylalanine--D-glutamate ligase
VHVEEASSYQLESCSVLKPAVSVILNIHEGHLERHGSIERYAAATAKVMRLQDVGDFAVINGDDARVVGIAKSGQAMLGVFGTKSPPELEKISHTYAHISFRTSVYGSIELSMGGSIERYETERCRIIGAHNRYNIAAAILVARRLGVSPAGIQRGIESFVPLEHRLEEVLVDTTRTVINDSKSTTVAATSAAVVAIREKYPQQMLVVLIGGLSKAGSWGTLMSLIAKWTTTRVQVVCFGEDANLLAHHGRSHALSPKVFGTLREATNFALGEIRAGGVVLLSPGCSSFDEFRDYVHRGAEFKRYVVDHEARGVGVST